MKATFFEILGSELAVVWDDRHESYYPLEALRLNCPCANCQGEPDLFGRVSTPGPMATTPKSFEIDSLERVGNYGLQFNWSDGHGWGIWTWERLRAVCPCEICKPKVDA